MRVATPLTFVVAPPTGEPLRLKAIVFPESPNGPEPIGRVRVALRLVVPPNAPEALLAATFVESLVGVHDGNLNEPMRVCQLPAVPFV